MRDAAEPVYKRFADDTLRRLAAGDLERMIETHRRAPFGPHPDDLSRVLYFLRAQETLGKYVIVGLAGGTRWSLARLTGRRSEGSVAYEPEVYESIADAEHAAFASRLRQCGLVGTNNA